MFGQNIIKRPLFYGAGGGSGTINSTGSCGGCSYCRPTKKKKEPSPLEQLAEQAEEETVEESIEPEYSGSVFFSHRVISGILSAYKKRGRYPRPEGRGGRPCCSSA